MTWRRLGDENFLQSCACLVVSSGVGSFWKMEFRFNLLSELCDKLIWFFCVVVRLYIYFNQKISYRRDDFVGKQKRNANLISLFHSLLTKIVPTLFQKFLEDLILFKAARQFWFNWINTDYVISLRSWINQLLESRWNAYSDQLLGTNLN